MSSLAPLVAFADPFAARPHDDNRGDRSETEQTVPEDEHAAGHRSPPGKRHGASGSGRNQARTLRTQPGPNTNTVTPAAAPRNTNQ